MQIASNVKDIIIIVAVGLVLFFGYKTFFSVSGPMELIKKNVISTEERTRREALEDRVIEEKLEAATKKLDEAAKAIEPSRQHIGTNTRNVYHPNMKRYKSETLEEKFKSANDLFVRYGLPTE